MKRQKICFIVSSPLSARVFLKAHMVELQKEYDIWLVANFSDNPDFIVDGVDLSGTKNIKISRSAISVKENFLVLVELFQFLKKEKFDLVHSLTPKAGLIGMLAARMAGVKFRIHTFTGQIWANDKGIKRIIFKNIDKIIDALASHSLVDGFSQRAYLLKERVVSNKSRVLANGSVCGVDFNRFHPRKDIQQELRKKLGYMHSDIVFIFIGRLNEDKGVPELVEAFIELRKEVKNIYLLLVGPDEGEIEQIIEKSDGINFYGYTNEPEILFNAGNVFCLPSHREGFGSSIIEASATALPVICSDVYGVRDAFKHEYTGLRHKVGNAKDLKKMMKTLALDKELRERLGENGLYFVKNNFEESIVVKAFLDFYNFLLQTTEE